MDILVGALAAWGGVMLVWTVAGAVIMPLSRSKDLKLTVVLQGKGDVPRLKRYVKGLLWLREMGLVWWKMAILNDELSADACARAAQFIEKENSACVLSSADLIDWMDS